MSGNYLLGSVCIIRKKNEIDMQMGFDVLPSLCPDCSETRWYAGSGVGYFGHSEFGIEYFEIIQLSIKGIDSKLDL